MANVYIEPPKGRSEGSPIEDYVVEDHAYHVLKTCSTQVENRTWAAWTPSGYCTASPGGEDMIGWHVNRGWDQAADFFPASKFRDQFARPDVVAKVLDTLDEAEAVKLANVARGGRVEPVKPILERLPPVLTILSPTDGAAAGDEVKVDYLASRFEFPGEVVLQKLGGVTHEELRTSSRAS